jgi:hypothetical protein
VIKSKQIFAELADHYLGGKMPEQVKNPNPMILPRHDLRTEPGSTLAWPHYAFRWANTEQRMRPHLPSAVPRFNDIFSSDTGPCHYSSSYSCCKRRWCLCRERELQCQSRLHDAQSQPSSRIVMCLLSTIFSNQYGAAVFCPPI